MPELDLIQQQTQEQCWTAEANAILPQEMCSPERGGEGRGGEERGGEERGGEERGGREATR